MDLNEQQRQELKRREELEDIHYGTECPKCDFDFITGSTDEFDCDNYEIDGVKYPIITGYNCYEGDEWWTEDHICPNCKNEVRYNDGN